MPAEDTTDSNVPGSTGPKGEGNYKVKQGECVASIVADTGLNWEKVWNLPENAKLKSARKDDAGALLPGDLLYVPERELKTEECQTEDRYKFRKHVTTSLFRIAFEGYNGPRSGEPYRIVIDGIIKEGELDDKGQLEEVIPNYLKKIVLYLGSEPTQEIFDINLGALDPCTELSGIQARLNQLCYGAGPVDNLMGPLTRAAIINFQEDHCADQYNLVVDGIPGPKTQEALEKEYESHTSSIE